MARGARSPRIPVDWKSFMDRDPASRPPTGRPQCITAAERRAKGLSRAAESKRCFAFNPSFAKAARCRRIARPEFAEDVGRGDVDAGHERPERRSSGGVAHR
jgi:hypothetical protein